MTLLQGEALMLPRQLPQGRAHLHVATLHSWQKHVTENEAGHFDMSHFGLQAFEYDNLVTVRWKLSLRVIEKIKKDRPQLRRGSSHQLRSKRRKKKLVALRNRCKTLL